MKGMRRNIRKHNRRNGMSEEWIEWRLCATCGKETIHDEHNVKYGCIPFVCRECGTETIITGYGKGYPVSSDDYTRKEYLGILTDADIKAYYDWFDIDEEEVK